MRASKTLVALATLAVVSLLSVASVSALSVGARAPEIGERDLNGRQIRMRSLRGKVVVVDFWASWCGPCRQAMPALERIYRQYRDQGLVVIGVSVDRNASNARGFLRRTRVSFPIVHDARHQIAGRYSPSTMPSTFVVDKRGVVRHVHRGFRSGDGQRLEREVRALLR